MSASMTAPDPEKLKKLIQLRLSGEISEEEFARSSGQDYSDSETAQDEQNAARSTGRSTENTGAQEEARTNKLACILHLSQLSAFLLPLVGLLVPAIIWFCFHKKHPELSEHIRVYWNWVISIFVFTIVLGILAMTPIAMLSIAGLFALVAASIIFPIVAGIKASGGEVWPYPLSLQIF